MKLFRKLGIAGLFSVVLSGLALADEDANGIWKLDSGKVTVRIAPCGSSLCGAIVGLAKPLDKKGRPKVDKKNPNEGLRKRPLIGLTVMANMRPAGANKWRGTIYNADDGRTYSSHMKLSGNNMKVKGCVENRLLTILFDDDGPGIPVENREDAFRPFVRLDHARNLDETGTGLGLAIALDIAHAHGGEIKLDESPAGGLRAVVLIPV